MKEIELKDGQAAQGMFASVLAGMKRGEVLSDLDEELRKLVIAVQKANRPGALLLKITVSPNGENNGTPLFKIEEDITAKTPKQKRSTTSLFYGDEEGGLFRRDPKQMEIASFREVPGGKPAPESKPEDAPQKASNG